MRDKGHRNIISTEDLTFEEIDRITSPLNDESIRQFFGKIVSLLFFSPSTRTRLSFVKSSTELGATPVVLNPNDLRLTDGESIKDTATAISTYSDLIGLRVLGVHNDPKSYDRNELFDSFIKHSSVPIINMCCNKFHPAQALADLKTLRESFRYIHERRIVVSWAYSDSWLRPPSMPNELLLLLCRFGLNITLAHPPGFELEETILEQAYRNAEQNGGALEISHDRISACSGADVVYARNWVTKKFESDNSQTEQRQHDDYRDWCFADSWLRPIAPNIHFMHCLPVHRNCEAEDSLIDGNFSLIKQQMFNRTHAQRRLLSMLLEEQLNSNQLQSPVKVMHLTSTKY